jgi:hypothetical protein
LLKCGKSIRRKPIKRGGVESVSKLRKLVISLKIATGDNKHAAAYTGALEECNIRMITCSKINSAFLNALVAFCTPVELTFWLT